jgi:hypothetical protein
MNFSILIAIFQMIIYPLNIIKILLIAKINIKERNISPNLALIQWYDFISQSNPYLYGCPLLKFTEIYNFVDIEAIQDIVHIIPRFDSVNEHFVNKFIYF